MKFISTLAVASAVASLASAFVNPTEPIGSSVWKPGTKVNITWTDDKNPPLLSSGPVFDILLMTGADQQQVPLETIATDVKGAGEGGSYEYTVPFVDPPGKIYFLMFKTKDGNGMAWATRFHITDANGVKGTLEPTGPVNQITGAVGSIVPSPTPAATTPAASPTGDAKDPKATAAGKPEGAAGALKIPSAAAAVAGFVGAAALALF
ncbi:hypothetical protein BGW42_004552 [Actinomortierella wolfii]|nr:hypothetical protein BGW42_004552 [Actinomortierella wolfii]